MSAGPPAPNGTRILTVRAGYSCAAAATKVPASTVRAMHSRAIADMGPPPRQNILGGVGPAQALVSQFSAMLKRWFGMVLQRADAGYAAAKPARPKVLPQCSPPSAPSILHTWPTWSF